VPIVGLLGVVAVINQDACDAKKKKLRYTIVSFVELATSINKKSELMLMRRATASV